MFIGRPIRTEISLTSPSSGNKKDPGNRSGLLKNVVKIAKNFDKHCSGKVREFNIGYFVYFSGRNCRGETFWREGVIQGRRGAVSYRVVTPEGDKHLRHVNQLSARMPPIKILDPVPAAPATPVSETRKVQSRFPAPEAQRKYPQRNRKPTDRLQPGRGNKKSYV